ncbi:MAG: ferrochelatase [Xanthobacteraceae bacterium]
MDRGTLIENAPSGHPRVEYGKIGVLLINLGTPDATDPASIRRYLAEFLSDRRVIEWSRWLWYPILYGLVLNTRPRKVGKAYAKIWNKERDESYLRTFTRSQALQLTNRLSDLSSVRIEWAMRYGQPSIRGKIEELQRSGCERILLYPLYPQYAAATTATVNDESFRALVDLRWQPAIRTVPRYHDDPIYIDALARSIESFIPSLGWEPDMLLTSYHGIPMSYFMKGDPYHCQCQKTTRLLRERLGWDEDRIMVTFQSRFGPEEWLQPYTAKTLEQLARNGTKRVAVINPGFVSDCLETLEEIAVEAKEIFLHNGGERFAHVPCLNDGSDGMKVIEHIVREELSGWV